MIDYLRLNHVICRHLNSNVFLIVYVRLDDVIFRL